MSEKEKAMLEKLAALPEPLQDRFLDRIQGATMALDLIKPPNKEGGPDHEQGEGCVSGHDGGA